METGELIRAARIKRGLTQKQLGDLCGMADSAIRRYESGRGNPTQRTIQRLAAALGVDPYSLYSWDQASDAISEEINDAAQYRAQVDEIMEKVTAEGLRIGKEVFETIAGNPKYQLSFDPIPYDDELGQTDTTPPPDAPETPPEGE